ncbi:hypothetical protein [Parashewanella curva]|uniref:hypothetical protein n=1 Tax=Parashewanella curva TaxID=2338552 RepID=UPI00140493F9|nr:hypothetical protein [Parashewanella curva]
MKPQNTPSVASLFENGLIQVTGEPEKIEAFSRYIFNKLFLSKVESTYAAANRLEPSSEELTAFSCRALSAIYALHNQFLDLRETFGDTTDRPEELEGIDSEKYVILSKPYSLFAKAAAGSEHFPEWIKLKNSPFALNENNPVINDPQFWQTFLDSLAANFISAGESVIQFTGIRSHRYCLCCSPKLLTLPLNLSLIYS